MKTKKRRYGKVTGSPPCQSIRSFPVNPSRAAGPSSCLGISSFPTPFGSRTTVSVDRNLAPLHRDEGLNQLLRLAAGDDLVIMYVCRQSRPRRPGANHYFGRIETRRGDRAMAMAVTSDAVCPFVARETLSGHLVLVFARRVRVEWDAQYPHVHGAALTLKSVRRCAQLIS